MRNMLRDNRGATSVLVVFMMIIMVVFATLAFTTAYANYRLAQKAVHGTVENYALDNLAAQMEMKVDSALANAEIKAQNAIRTGATSGQLEGLTFEQSEKVRARFMATGSLSPEALLPDLMARLFLQYAAQELETFAAGYGGVYVEYKEPYADGDFFAFDKGALTGEELSIHIALTTGSEQGDKQLDIEIGILPIRYTLSQSGGAVSGGRAEDFAGRYQVLAWKQWQVPFEYDDGLEFGDARISLEDLE